MWVSKLFILLIIFHYKFRVIFTKKRVDSSPPPCIRILSGADLVKNLGEVQPKAPVRKAVFFQPTGVGGKKDDFVEQAIRRKDDTLGNTRG